MHCENLNQTTAKGLPDHSCLHLAVQAGASAGSPLMVVRKVGKDALNVLV